MHSILIEQTLTDYIELSLSGARDLPANEVKSTKAECAELQKARDRIMLHRLVDQYMDNIKESTDLTLVTHPQLRINVFVGFLTETFDLQDL